MTSVIAFFIIVACAGAIYSVAPRDIQSAAEAAVGLRPFGQYATILFAAGLFNASLFAACILPLIDVVFGVRRIGVRIGSEQALPRGADFLLAVHAADRGRRGQ